MLLKSILKKREAPDLIGASGRWDKYFRETSQVMLNKIMAVRRDRRGAQIGRAGVAALAALGRRLAPIVGIVD